MHENAIEIRGLEKAFPKFKLGPIDLTAPRGAIYGFVGPNGAGKTTTIDLIFGIGAKDSGSVNVLGLDHITDEVEVKRQAGAQLPDVGTGRQGDPVCPRFLSFMGRSVLPAASGSVSSEVGRKDRGVVLRRPHQAGAGSCIVVETAAADPR